MDSFNINQLNPIAYKALKSFYTLMPDPSHKPHAHAAWDKAWKQLLKFTFNHCETFPKADQISFIDFHTTIGEHFFELNA